MGNVGESCENCWSRLMRTGKMIMHWYSLVVVCLAFNTNPSLAQPSIPPEINARVNQEDETCICNDDASVCLCCETQVFPAWFGCDILVDGKEVTDEKRPVLVLAPDDPTYTPKDAGLDEGDLDRMVATERGRLRAMAALTSRSKSGLQALRVRDLVQLRCSLSAGGWIECAWPYAHNLCVALDWTPRRDGTCGLRIE